MSTYKINLASNIIEIDDRFDAYLEFFMPFFSEASPDFQISTIMENKCFSSLPGHEHEIERWFFSNSVQLFFDNLFMSLIDHDTLLMHCATIAIQDSAYAFCAPSGTGKTTHILKWLEHLSNTVVVNGDKPFLKFTDSDTVYACGSPWAGKENMYTNTVVPLKSIILMERAENNCIEQISFSKAFPFLLQQVYRPDDEDKMRKTLRLMQRLNGRVSFWHFRCNNFKDDCFEIAYNALVMDQK